MLAEAQEKTRSGLLRFEPMTAAEFKRMSEFVHSECGIKMPPSKKTMLESRLLKRLKSLEMESFSEYCEYAFSPEGTADELVHMIDVVTTNKTDFFREPDHFAYMTTRALPELTDMKAEHGKRRINVWSAGCATGEEPYTLAIVLSEYVERAPGFGFSVLATDISTAALRKASLGIYDIDKTEPVPPGLLKKYFLKSKDEIRRQVRVDPGLRTLVGFRRLNLMDEDFGLDEPADMIFCRNVLIYFDRPTQERLINRFCKYLDPGGFIFVGHSESLAGLDVPLTLAAPAVYRMRGAATGRRNIGLAHRK